MKSYETLSKDKLNNKGFSLIELIVAMTILAIIAIPILHSFVTAANTNMKATRVMGATSLAQDIFEGIKNTSVEKLLIDVNSSEDRAMFGRVVPGANAYEVNFVSDVYVDKIGEDVITSIKSGKLEKKDTYMFALTDVYAGDSRFDAIVTLDATGGSSNPYTTTGGYNDVSVASIGNLDALHSGIYIFTDEDASAATIFEGRSKKYLGNASVSSNLFLNEAMSKTITVTIDKPTAFDEDGNPKERGAKVTINTLYSVTDYVKPEASEQNYSLYESTLFDDFANENELRNVYIFYKPFYNSSRDNFIIDNKCDYPVNVYIVKLSDDYGITIYNSKITLQGEMNNTTIRTNTIGKATFVDNAVGTPKYESLDGLSRKNQIYSVNIKVFEAGKSYTNLISEFTGSKVD